MELRKEKYTKNIKVKYMDTLIDEIVEDMLGFLCNNDESNLCLVKVKRDTKVYKYKHDNQTYYIKAYLHKKKKLKNYFRYKAFRNIKITKSLMDNEIPVFKPYISISYKNFPSPNRSLFITREFKGVSATEFLLDNHENTELKNKFIKDMAYICSKMYNNGFVQGDPNLDNIMVKLHSNEGREQSELDIVLVDVDGIKKWPFLTENMVIKNLAKFNALIIRN